MPREGAPSFNPEHKQERPELAPENPEHIVERKRAEFDALKNEIKNWRTEGRNPILTAVLKQSMLERVLSNSLRDGLELTREFGFTGAYLKSKLLDGAGANFFLKKADFFKQMKEYKDKHETPATEKLFEREKFNELLNEAQQAPEKRANEDARRESNMQISPSLQEMLDRIDNYYKDFLQTRKIGEQKNERPEKLPFELSALDEKALRLIQKYLDAKSEKYERSGVMKVLFKLLQRFNGEEEKSATAQEMKERVVRYLEDRMSGLPSRLQDVEILADIKDQNRPELLEKHSMQKILTYFPLDERSDRAIERARYTLPKEIFILERNEMMKRLVNELIESGAYTFDSKTRKLQRADQMLPQSLKHADFQHNLVRIIANLEHVRDVGGLESFMRKYGFEFRQEIGNMISGYDGQATLSKKHLSFFNRQLTERPLDMLKTVSAMVDAQQDKDAFFNFLFQGLKEEVARIESAQVRRAASDSRQTSEMLEMAHRPEDVFALKESIDFFGTDPRSEEGEPLLYANRALNEFLIQEISGSYDREQGTFRPATFPIEEASAALEGAMEEFEFGILLERERDTASRMQLPVLLGAHMERVTSGRATASGITSEQELEQEKESFGRQNIYDIPPNVDFVRYRMHRASDYKLPEPIDARTYDAVMKEFEQAYGVGYTERITDQLPPELKLFIKKIESLEPLEKIVAIETQVRAIAHYDMDNRDVMAAKQGLNPDEQLHFMQSRMNELRGKNLSLNAPGQKNKLYAGVCADFALLSLALLREAKIPSGSLVGLMPDRGASQLFSKDGHQTAYAIWPGEKSGAYRIIPVDGTPAAARSYEEVVERNHRALPSLKDQFVASNQEQPSLAASAEDPSREIAAQYQLTKQGAEVLRALVDALQYSPFAAEADSFDEKKFAAFVARTIDQTRSRTKVEDAAQSTEINQLTSRIEHFIKKDPSGAGMKKLCTALDSLADVISHEEREAMTELLRYASLYK